MYVSLDIRYAYIYDMSLSDPSMALRPVRGTHAEGSMVGSLEFCVAALKTRCILVLGHTQCLELLYRCIIIVYRCI